MALSLTRMCLVASVVAIASAAECPALEKYWVSDPYTAEKVDALGVATTLRGLAATMTISSQHDCAFEGYHEWSNGEIGGREFVAGVISTPEPGAVAITMVELGAAPEGGSTASFRGGTRIDGVLVDGAMKWRYAGRGKKADDRWVTVFDAVFAPNAAPGRELDCASVATALGGVWESDAVFYQRLYEDGRHEALGPARNTLRLTMEDDCLVSGTNSWDDGAETGTEVLAGVVHSGERSVTLLELGGTDVDGRIELTLDEDFVMALHFVGGTADSSYELVFDTFLGKNEPPNVAGPRCAGLDLTGVWQSQTYSHFEVRAGDENVTVVPDVSRTFTVTNQENCTFWGFDGDLALLGLVHEDGQSASISEIGHADDGAGASAVVDVHIEANGDLKWHYVGLTADLQTAAVFDATFPSLYKQPLDEESDGAASIAPLLWLLVALAASS